MFKLFVLTLSLLLQVITSQSFCNGNLPSWSGIINPSPPWTGVYQPCANLPYYPQDQYGMDISSLSASSNYGFPITSSSPIAPGIVSIKSENAIEGPISVYGQLPFLSAVAFDGSVPTFGYGGVAYNCGTGNVGILSESITESYELAPGRPDFDILPIKPGVGIPSGRPGVGSLPRRLDIGYGIGSGVGPACY